MTIGLLHEYVRVLVERENDALFLRMANNSFLATEKLLRAALEGGQKTLSGVVGKVNGRFTWVNLGAAVPRPEHEGLYLFFVDRNAAGAKPTLTAAASMSNAQPREYRISIFVDSGTTTAKEWNEAFQKHVMEWLVAARVSYIHEFVHVLDYRRMTDEYIQGRNDTRRQRRASGEKKDFSAYMNDPMETNAYTQESFARVLVRLRKAKTAEEWESIMGSTPGEFAEKFVSKYLDRRARKHWTEKNLRKVISRAIAFWESQKQKFDAAKK